VTNTDHFIGELGKVVPCGVYAVGANTGWVNVGTDAGTGAFVVESIHCGWTKIGCSGYPGARRLLITRTAGGPTMPDCGCGANWRSWPPRPGLGSPCATCHLQVDKIEHRMGSIAMDVGQRRVVWVGGRQVGRTGVI
jgi:hypothetical protein